MEREFYLSYRKAAIKPALYAFVFAGLGIFSHYSIKAIDAYLLNFIPYFFYAASLYLLIIFCVFILRPNGKYVLITESTLTVFRGKTAIEIPRSQIVQIKLCQSPITYRAFEPYGPVDVGEIATLLKISLRDTHFLESMKSVSDYKRHFFQSQFVHISDDNKDIYLRSSPIGGFGPLLRALKE